MGVLHAAHLLELAETEFCNMADLDGLERRLSGIRDVVCMFWNHWIYSLQHISFCCCCFLNGVIFGEKDKYLWSGGCSAKKKIILMWMGVKI